MTPLWLWLSIAGGVGALSRFVTDGVVRARFGNRLPWGTLFINTGGSLLLGLLTNLATHGHLDSGSKLILGTGFCGGFTTFSTASFETVRLIEEQRFYAAFWHAAANIGLSCAAAMLGLLLPL